MGLLNKTTPGGTWSSPCHPVHVEQLDHLRFNTTGRGLQLWINLSERPANVLVCQYSLGMDKDETKLYVKSNRGHESDPTMWNRNFLDDFKSFSHYWGGLFAQFVTMLLSLLRFEAICVWCHSVSLRLGYGHFNTSNCFFFRHSRCPTRIFLQREATKLCFVFKRVLTPCFVDQSLCSPDFYLEAQIKVGLLYCESPFAPRCCFAATTATMGPLLSFFLTWSSQLKWK